MCSKLLHAFFFYIFNLKEVPKPSTKSCLLVTQWSFYIFPPPIAVSVFISIHAGHSGDSASQQGAVMCHNSVKSKEKVKVILNHLYIEIC